MSASTKETVPDEDFRGFRERPLKFEPTMSDAEALMWQLEKDPWLDPSGAVVTILDQPIDADALRDRMSFAVASVPRLRDRVVPGIAPLSPPQWLPDPEFDIDFHLRHVALPAPGSEQQLFDLAAQLYQDPFDRTRPLWKFWIVDGIEGGRGALISKMHHTIADGIGAVRLAEIYMDIEREGEATPEVDLEAIIEADERFREDIPGLPRRLQSALGHQVRRQGGILRRTLGEVVSWTADPQRPLDVSAHSIATARALFNELFGGGADDDESSGDEPSGSPLWHERSRHRSLYTLDLEVDAMKKAAKKRGGTINDLFLAGIAEGAIAYHAEHGGDLNRLNMTYIVSTRTDHAIGGNSFVPSKISVAADGSFDERFTSIHRRTTARKSEAANRVSLDGLAGVAAALPPTVLTQVARQQARTIDIATSNLRAAPFTVYIGGAKALRNYPMGPLAGTACNITTLSYDGQLGVGLFIDPTAIADPEGLRDHIQAAFKAVL